MSKLFDSIRSLVRDERYLIGLHAAERLEERGILEWQAVGGLVVGEVLVQRPLAKPHPAIEVLQMLPDGTEYKAVWSLLSEANVAKLVIVHYFDEV